MTILKANNADIGVSSGTTVTTGNSGGGTGNDAFSGVNIGAGCTLQAVSSGALDGPLSFVASQPTGVSTTVEARWSLPSPVADFNWEMRWKADAAPSAPGGAQIFRAYTDASYTVVAFTLFYRADGKLHLYDVIDSAQSASSSVALTPGTEYIFKGRSNAGVNTVTVYPEFIATPTTSVSQSGLTVRSIQSVNPVRIQTGTSGTSAVLTTTIDTIRIGDAPIARLDVANSAPTTSVGADYYGPSAPVSLAATDSDSDGSIASRLWSWSLGTGVVADGSTPTITNPTLANATVTPPVGYSKIGYQVTDDQGATSTIVYKQFFVHPANGVDNTVRSATVGSGATFGSGATVAARLSDSDTTTGVASGNDPAGTVTAKALMNPYGPGAITAEVTSESTGGVMTAVCEWLAADGVTLVDSQPLSPVAQAVADGGPGPTALTATMDAGGLAAVATLELRAALYIQVKSTS